MMVLDGYTDIRTELEFLGLRKQGGRAVLAAVEASARPRATKVFPFFYEALRGGEGAAADGPPLEQGEGHGPRREFFQLVGARAAAPAGAGGAGEEGAAAPTGVFGADAGARAWGTRRSAPPPAAARRARRGTRGRAS